MDRGGVRVLEVGGGGEPLVDVAGLVEEGIAVLIAGLLGLVIEHLDEGAGELGELVALLLEGLGGGVVGGEGEVLGGLLV